MTPQQPDLNLAVIGNCQVAALLDNCGRIVWCCLPALDGDPVFSALLTAEGGAARSGVFAVDVANVAKCKQEYVRNTAIVETTLSDSASGVVRITDFCPRFRGRGRVFRPMMLVRIVEPVAGRPIVRMRLRPTCEYGKRTPTKHFGSHHLRFATGDLDFRVTTDASLSIVEEDRPAVLTHPVAFILGPDETLEEAPATLARSFLEETRNYWQDWVRTLAISFDWQEAVIRAAITLKLCTYEDSGAVVAALTTSIPESPQSRRNWDYRYCWLRDSYFVLQALNRLGATRTMEAYLHYFDHLLARSADGDLQPLYTIRGDADADERDVDSLAGYRGMGPVRVGNQAARQVQHDVYGSVILATTQLFYDERLTRVGDRALFERLQSLGNRAAIVFERPDAGPWELRGEQHTHTFSAAISWAGCDRLARLAARIGETEIGRRWRARANEMRERILARAWSERRKAFVTSFGGDQLDATALVLADLGLVTADDPRFHATVDAIGRELREGDLVFRYRHADDFGPPQSAFTVCAFWYVNALAATGRRDEAREHFDRLLKRRNPLGLLSEDIEPKSGELWGNFPQTYSMVGIITSALRLSRSWEEAS
ncbi:MAG TPA: glycoside hydrolase family 15 protein [Steroidobacteraceae bacterium]|nr:glycoside hydrolase family 15 protein [Steroidobacteraceae bacterium]